MRKTVSGLPTRSDTNRAIQSQKMVRGFKFQIKKVVGTICVFVFAYAKIRFSHDTAHMIQKLTEKTEQLTSSMMLYQVHWMLIPKELANI